MIIKTANQKETEVAAGLKATLRRLGIEVYVIPYGVNYLWVSIDEFNGENQIYVQATKGDTDEILDTTIGFDSCDEAYAYARKIAFEAGLDEDSADGDVWDQEEEAQ